MKVVITVGLPGSGKSTYLRELGVNPISSDALRLQLADDENCQSIHPQVFAAMRYLLAERLKLGRETTYIDATNLTVRDRRPWFEVAAEYGAEVEALYFDVPLEVCKARNAARNRVVPADALEAMAAKLVAPSPAEGFLSVRTRACRVGTHPDASTAEPRLPGKSPVPSAG